MKKGDIVYLLCRNVSFVKNVTKKYYVIDCLKHDVNREYGYLCSEGWDLLTNLKYVRTEFILDKDFEFIKRYKKILFMNKKNKIKELKKIEEEKFGKTESLEILL